MAITRSMSGTTKKSNTKIAENHKVPRKVKPRTYSKARSWTIKDDAFNIFMMKDYLKRYYESHPHPTTGVIADEADYGGKLEWSNMSDIDKNTWIEYAKKRKDEGTSLLDIQAECYATYPIY